MNAMRRRVASPAVKCRMPRVPHRAAAAAPARRFVLAARAALVLLAALFALSAAARDFELGALMVEHPYARPTPPGARTGAVYFTLRNAGKEADRLVRVASPVAASAELHTMTMEGDLMKMRPVAGIDVPAGGSVTLGTHGHHVMLVGIAQPLAVGDEVPLTLTFEKAGTVQVQAAVEAAGASANKH
jgi:copper(I)-binding protein